MGRDLSSVVESVRSLFDEADRALGYPLSRLCFEGPEGELRLTANAQPAILTVSVAAARTLSERGIRAGAVAGHSLGEYSALVTAGALSFQDAVVAVHKRGRYMQEAVPVGERQVTFDGAATPTKIYDRASLAPGFKAAGPAVIEEFGSTTLIGPKDRFEIGELHEIRIHCGEA